MRLTNAQREMLADPAFFRDVAAILTAGIEGRLARRDVPMFLDLAKARYAYVRLTPEQQAQVRAEFEAMQPA